MENNCDDDRWNDLLEIEGDDRDDVVENLETEEEIHEYEAWLDEQDFPIDHDDYRYEPGE